MIDTNPQSTESQAANTPTPESEPVATQTPETKKPSKLPVFIVGGIVAVFLLVLCVILTAVAIIAVNPAEKLNATPSVDPTTTSSSISDPSQTTKTYTSDVGDFSFTYPSNLEKGIDETLIDVTDPPYDDPGVYSLIEIPMSDGRAILTVAYHNDTETVDMPIYGGAAGDFVLEEPIDFLGQPLENYELNYEGETIGYYYNMANDINRGSLVFAISLTPERFQGQISSEALMEANKILESFYF